MKRLLAILILLLFSSLFLYAAEQSAEELADSILKKQLSSSRRVGAANPIGADILSLEFEAQVYQSALISKDPRFKALTAIMIITSASDKLFKDDGSMYTEKERLAIIGKDQDYVKLKEWYLSLLDSKTTRLLKMPDGKMKIYRGDDPDAKKILELSARADMNVSFSADGKLDIGVGPITDGAIYPKTFSPTELEHFFDKQKHKGLVVIFFDKACNMDGYPIEKSIKELNEYFFKRGYAHVVILQGLAFGVGLYSDLENPNNHN